MKVGSDRVKAFLAHVVSTSPTSVVFSKTSAATYYCTWTFKIAPDHVPEFEKQFPEVVVSSPPYGMTADN